MGRKRKIDFTDVIGKRYGSFTVISFVDYVGSMVRVYCKCECGTEKTTYLTNLKKLVSDKCRCVNGVNDQKYINKKYGRLTILNFVGFRNCKKIVLAECECKVIKEYRFNSLLTGNTLSCGCLQTENVVFALRRHGQSNHPLMSVWGCMIERCYNQNNISYPDYGGRGVTVCDEWRKDFKSFFDWAIKTWKPGLMLDKDILSGDSVPTYSPSTCLFVTRKENANKTRMTVFIEYEGQKRSMAEWSEKIGIPYKNLRHRIRKLKWPIQKAFTQPVKFIKKAA